MTGEVSFTIMLSAPGWMSLACNHCRRVIWQGEQSFWDLTQFTAMQFMEFIYRHKCR